VAVVEEGERDNGQGDADEHHGVPIDKIRSDEVSAGHLTLREWQNGLIVGISNATTLS
jgi:hypothetical protein